MKNLFKNLALIALILAIAAPAFAAKTPKNKDGTQTVEVWYGSAVTEAGPPPSNWVVYNIVKDKLKINLKITALPSSETDQDTKINAAGAANALPDLFMVSSTAFANLQKQGLLAPVDDMFAMMPNRTKVLYDKDAIAFSTINKKCYALAQPGSIVKNEGVLIRKDWLDKLGLKIPVTTDEYFAVMKAFTEKDPDGNGRADTYGYGAFLEVSAPNAGFGRRLDPIFGAFGVAGTWNLSTKKDSGMNIFKPEYYEAMVYLKKMVDEKVIDPNWMAYKKDDFRAAWKQGRFGIMREQNAAYASQSNYAPFDKNFPKGEWVVIEPPTGPKGKKSAGTYTQSYRMYAVSASQVKKYSDKKELIAKLLEWMSGDEGYYLLGWGQKDVNYTLDANGVPSKEGLKDPSKAYTSPEAQPLTQLRNMVYYNGDIELAARYPTYTTDSGKQMSALKALRQMQATAWTACIGQDKMPKPGADLERFYNQGVLEFMTGKRQLTKPNWDAFVNEYKQMGGADLEKEGIKLGIAEGYIK